MAMATPKRRAAADVIEEMVASLLADPGLATGSDAFLSKLKRTCTRLSGDGRYNEDERLVRLIVHYADLSDEPCNVFRRAKQQGVGRKHALFWAAWSVAAIAEDNFDLARRVVNEGISHGASPAKLLQQANAELKERECTSSSSGTPKERRKPLQKADRVVQSGHGYQQQENSRQTNAQEEKQKHEQSAINRRDKTELASFEECTDLLLLPPSSARENIQAEARTPESAQFAEAASSGPSSAPPAALVVDPFAVAHRKEHTVGQPAFKEWAASAQDGLIFDVNNESLSKWPRKLKPDPMGLNRKSAAIKVQLGSRTVELLGLLGQGSYAQVFACRLRSTGEEVAIKVERPRFSLLWECYVILQLKKRAAKELNASQRPPRILRPRQLFCYRDGLAMPMRMGLSGTIHDLVVAHKRAGREGIPELVVIHYAAEMMSTLQALHTLSILHCDIKTDNWLLLERSGESTVYLIDFGRAIDLSLYPNAGKFIAFRSEDKVTHDYFASVEMRCGQPWKHQVDLYGLASTLHFMLFGDYLKPRMLDAIAGGGEGSCSWAPSQRMRRYWDVELWEQAFHMLINAPGYSTYGEGSSTQPLLSKLESRFRDRLNAEGQKESLAELLRKQQNMLLKT
jgi:hypothetical protein